jgi:hypothetical protein
MASKLYLRDSDTGQLAQIKLNQKGQSQIQLGIKEFTNLIEGDSNLNFFTQSFPINYRENMEALKLVVDNTYEPGQELTGQSVDAVLEIGFLTFEGAIKFGGYDKARGEYTIRAQFISGLESLTRRLPEFARDLPFGTFEFTAANIEAYQQANYNIPYNGNNELYWSDKYYQGNVASNTYTTATDVKPDIHMAAITTAMGRQLGQPIRSQFFQTEFYRNILHPYVGKNVVEAQYVEAELTADLSFGSILNTLDLSVAPWNVTFDPLGMILFGFESVLLLSDWDRVILRIEVDFDLAPDPNRTATALYMSGESLVVQDQATMLYGQNNKATLSGEYYGTGVNRRPYFLMGGPCTIQAGSKIKIFFEAETLAEGPIWFNKSTIPATLKTKDYIKGITGLFNLVWFYNVFDDTIVCEPKWPYTCPMTGEEGDGFYFNIALAEDWSDKLDCVDEKVDFKVNSGAQREFVLAFKEDNSDALVFDDLLYSYETLLAAKYKEGKKINRNEIFAPTVTGDMNENYSIAASLKVPLLVNDESAIEVITNEKYYDFEMRLLYKPGHYARAGYYLDGAIKTNMYPSPPAGYYSGQCVGARGAW